MNKLKTNTRDLGEYYIASPFFFKFTSPQIHSGVFSKGSIFIFKDITEHAVFKEYPKISHLDMRKIFATEFMIYSFWGKVCLHIIINILS